MGLKLNAGALGVVGVVGAGGMYTQSSNLQTNYQPIEAVVTEAKVDCFIENSDAKLENKTTGELSYMDCGVAVLAAVKFDFESEDIKQRVTATYRYRSPVDGKEYEGEFTRRGRNKAQALPVGKTVPVFASKTKPAKSRTSSGNMFIDDKYEI